MLSSEVLSNLKKKGDKFPSLTTDKNFAITCQRQIKIDETCTSSAKFGDKL